MLSFLNTVVISTILFYATGQPYDIFSNVTHVPVKMVLNGQSYQAASTEAVFQGLKRLGSSDNRAAESLIQNTRLPLSKLRNKAEQLGFNRLGASEIYNQSYRSLLTIKEEVMYQILLAKATQNLQILKALLETGQAKIVENTAINTKYNDEFWGNGQSGNGKNALGKAWMRVRETLRNELIKSGRIKKRVGLSDDLAQLLGHRKHLPGSQFDGSSITIAELQSTNSAILVSQLITHNNHRSNYRIGNNGSNRNHLLGTLPNQRQATNRVLKATGAKHLNMINDLYIPNRKVLKLIFWDKRKALAFSRFAGNATIQENTVFLGPNRATQVFKKLHVPIHGRTHPQPMWNALLAES